MCFENLTFLFILSMTCKLDVNRYRRQTTTKENITIEVLFVVDYAVYSRYISSIE
jgi:hypothetical protein